MESTFSALSEPNRRALLTRQASSERTVRDLEAAPDAWMAPFAQPGE